MPFDEKPAKERENRIITHITKNLPAGNGFYYIEDEEESQMFKCLEDQEQRKKTSWLN